LDRDATFKLWTRGRYGGISGQDINPMPDSRRTWADVKVP
jgi:hypothetical protein